MIATAAALITVALARRAGRTLALLCDYDGTLAPLAPHPRLARLPDTTRAVLERLARRPRVFLAVLSGRELADLRELVDLDGLCYAGTSGLEIDMRGRRVTHPRAEEFATWLPEPAAALESVVAGFGGAWVERKRLGLSIHFRQVAAGQVEPLQAAIAAATAPWAAAWRSVAGPRVVELVPREGWTKGDAVHAILENCGSEDMLPVYAGDSANDAEAMAAVAAAGGLSLGIGREAPPIANVLFASPEEYAAWLGQLDRLLAEE
jgi:trehalose-phosphatase